MVDFEESNWSDLGYLDMIVNQILRLHPLADPLVIPHWDSKDCTIYDFYILDKSRKLMNKLDIVSVVKFSLTYKLKLLDSWVV